MRSADLGAALRNARGADPASVPRLVDAAARELGAQDVVIYLVDFEQRVLEPLPGWAAHADLPEPESVSGTMAGRAFRDQSPVTAARNGRTRVWVPVVEGSDRTGVLAATVPDDSERTLRSCEELGLFAGYLIAAQARCTDLYNLHRRRRSMTLAASMQWDLLPPLVLKSQGVTVAGFLEPAYEIGGDSFDYAVNGPVLDLALTDCMGHGVSSAMMAGLVIGSYRHDRREGLPLEQIHANLDAALAAHYDGDAFTTGQLVRLRVDTGEMSWTNAGHPLPLLVRAGRVVGEISCRPTPPWGLGGGPATVATEALQPGDSVLLYTDGVIGARPRDGEVFGGERLAELAGHNSAEELAPEEIVRHLIEAVVEYQGRALRDDATIVILQWSGPSA